MFQGLFIDGFAGGGGASTGIAQAIGRDVDIAVNHSPSAIAIHRANHPGTLHFCQDIRALWPRAATKDRPVAGAWFSPDCKEHSKAKGGPVKDRNIRALPWEIPVWLKETRPTVVYLENVEEFELWGPLDETGHVIKELRGAEFKRWVGTIRRLGYRVQWRQLRACDYGAPTSRKRLYVVMRCDGKPIRWPKPTHGRPDSPGVRSGKLLPYRTAAECIDWSIPCPSIFDRKRELAEATKRRIAHGVMRYVVNAAKPFIVGTAFNNARASRIFDPADPLRTATTQNEFGVVDAELAQAAHITKFHTGSIGAPMDGQMPTVTSNGDPARPAGAMPLGMVGATLVPVTHQGAVRVHGLAEPFRTITGAHRGEIALSDVSIAPFITYGQHGGASRPPLAPHHTIAASSKDQNGLVGAALVKMGNGERAGQAPRALSAGKPLGTIVANRSNFAIVAAAMAPLQNGERRPGETPRAQDIRDPVSTIATGGKHAVVETSVIAAPFIDRQYGRSAPDDARQPLAASSTHAHSAAVTTFLSRFYGSDKTNGGGALNVPLATARAGGQHHAVVAAHMAQFNANPDGSVNAGHDMRGLVSTIATRGPHQGVIETTLVEEDALPPDMMARAVKVAAFLVKYYGSEVGQHQAVDKPIDVITGQARFAVVTVTIDAVTYVIVDIGLRMLKPRELARAQGFPDDYVLDPVVPKIKRGKLVHEPLTIAEQISAIGNSVCPPVARALVAENQPGIADVRMAA